MLCETKISFFFITLLWYLSLESLYKWLKLNFKSYVPDRDKFDCKSLEHKVTVLNKWYQ